MLFETTHISALHSFSNERGIFDKDAVHHGFKFCLLSYRVGGSSDRFTASFRINPRVAVRPSELTSFLSSESQHVEISVSLIRKLSPDSLSVPEFMTASEVVTASKLALQPMLGDQLEGVWNISFHREFHITDDANLYQPNPKKGLVSLVEGKMIHQFVYPFCEPRYWVDLAEARPALISGRKRALKKLCDTSEIKSAVSDDDLMLDYQSYRIAFRDIAASTNERTMIATVLPPNVVCPDTLRLEEIYFDAVKGEKLILNQQHLTMGERLSATAVLNSFIVDYQLRQKVTSHVSIFFLKQTSMPRLTSKDAAFRPLVERAARLVGTSAAYDELMKEVFGKRATHATHGLTDPAARQTARAEIDALVAKLYDLTEDEFTHILSTFPLVDESVKSETRNTYRELLRSGKLPS
jgi:hypothetical protein